MNDGVSSCVSLLLSIFRYFDSRGRKLIDLNDQELIELLKPYGNAIGSYFGSLSAPLLAGQSYTLTVDYQKATDDLSTTGLPVQPAEPITPSTPGRVNSSATLPWILAGVGVALIVFGGATAFYMWRKNQHGSPSPRKRHARILEDDGADAIYCTQCGKRAQAGDVFCRTCGTRLQKEE